MHPKSACARGFLPDAQEIGFVTHLPSHPPSESSQSMIEALKSEKIVEQIGGRFKLCTLIQKRLVELMDGARPLVERDGRRDLDLVVEEIVQGKIAIEDENGVLNPGGIAPVIDEEMMRELADKAEANREPAALL